MDRTLIFNFAAAMLSIVNPIGNVPLFISYTAGERQRVRSWLALFIALTVFVLLGVFLVIGTGLVKCNWGAIHLEWIGECDGKLN